MAGMICKLCGANIIIAEAVDGSEVVLDVDTVVWVREPDFESRPVRRFWQKAHAESDFRVLHESVCKGLTRKR